MLSFGLPSSVEVVGEEGGEEVEGGEGMEKREGGEEVEGAVRREKRGEGIEKREGGGAAVVNSEQRVPPTEATQSEHTEKGPDIHRLV